MRGSRFLNVLLLALLFAGANFAPAGGQGLLDLQPQPAGQDGTPTPAGAMIQVKIDEQDQVNLRAGPSAVDYEVVGVLSVGQQAPALGRSTGGDWIKIEFPEAPGGVAWVYAPLVDIQGFLPIIEPPPTPTPPVTATIDPTLAAQFLVDVPPTRLPTYTPPPPVEYPTYAPAAAGPADASGRMPVGMLIVAMSAVGVLGALVSLLGAIRR